jgi:murein DD-endopeptidase MepM/ murein hydrolase activator NlpD
MIVQDWLNDTRAGFGSLYRRMQQAAARQPALAAVLLLAIGVAAGAGARAGAGGVEMSRLQARTASQEMALAATRDGAQREVNALAARLAELQAQANRLIALGERLTQAAQLDDGEFDFDKPVGVGGVGRVRDMPARELRDGLDQLDAQFDTAGGQLSVLESLLFTRRLDQAATPSRMPIAHTWITSGFGGRADPFGGGAAFHKGIDFHASLGDPVLAVANGVVSYAGDRSGYGNVVEIDHGNGYVTRYAHNSRLLVRVGELVHQGEQIARAGSTGRSTGAHVHFEVWQDGRVVDPRRFLGTARPATRG